MISARITKRENDLAQMRLDEKEKMDLFQAFKTLMVKPNFHKIVEIV